METHCTHLENSLARAASFAVQRTWIYSKALTCNFERTQIVLPRALIVDCISENALSSSESYTLLKARAVFMHSWRICKSRLLKWVSNPLVRSRACNFHVSACSYYKSHDVSGSAFEIEMDCGLYYKFQTFTCLGATLALWPTSCLGADTTNIKLCEKK
jgi:hypothetical protein